MGEDLEKMEFVHACYTVRVNFIVEVYEDGRRVATTSMINSPTFMLEVVYTVNVLLVKVMNNGKVA